MTQHTLRGRSEKELLWYQRRSFLGAAAAWTASGGFAAAQAQQRGNIVELVGDAQLNGTRLRPDQTIQTGDNISTGPGTTLVFVVGNSSFKVRQNSRLSVERGDSLNAVSILQLITGAGCIWPGLSSRYPLPSFTPRLPMICHAVRWLTSTDLL